LTQSSAATTAAPYTGRVADLTVVAITDDDAKREMLEAAAAHLEGGVRLAFVASPADAADLQPEGPIAAYCLDCAADPDTAHRALGLLQGIAALAPILLLDANTGFSLEAALREGAWDSVSSSNPALLQARLRQIVDIGRVRHELLDAGQRLNQSQRRLDVLLSQGHDARATLDGSRVIDPNAAFARLLGLADAQTARGRDLLERIAPRDRSRVLEALEQVLRGNTDTTISFDLISPQGDRQPVRAVLAPGVSEGEGQRKVQLVLRTAERALPAGAQGSPRSAFDGRMALHQTLAQISERSSDLVSGLLFVAVDDVGELQRALGLAESDLLLQEVGLFLLQAVRGNDRIFRFGNGEYVMLVERHSANEMAESCRNLHAALAGETFGDGQSGASLSATLVHCTLGAQAIENAQRLQAVMDTAYELRAADGNACQEYRPEAPTGDPTQSDDNQWAGRLRHALTHDRFSLAYQSITSLAGDSQPYFDVLLRYVDDNSGLVRPGEFLPTAEKLNLMPEIDRWVTRRAIEVIRQQQAKNVHIALFVKLAAATIADGDAFADWVRDTLVSNAIARQNIIFSVREDDARSQAVQARKFAAALEALGFRIALTHYGSTPKAVQILDNMPASFIKLAPAFARKMLDGGEDERLAHIIASARERRLPLIAEQIEDANSMARLWQAGVNYVQGHFIQEPNTDALANTHDLNV